MSCFILLTGADSDMIKPHKSLLSLSIHLMVNNLYQRKARTNQSLVGDDPPRPSTLSELAFGISGTLFKFCQSKNISCHENWPKMKIN